MEVIKNKIQQLGMEADSLVNRRAGLEQELRNIETRLTQIVGAITELNSLVQETEKENDSETSKDS